MIRKFFCKSEFSIQSHIQFKTIEKHKFFYKPFRFNLTAEHIHLYKFHLQSCLRLPLIQGRRTNFWYKNGYLCKAPNCQIIQKHRRKQFPLQALQFQFNRRTNKIAQISSSKLPGTPHANRLVKHTFGVKMATSERIQFQI